MVGLLVMIVLVEGLKKKSEKKESSFIGNTITSFAVAVALSIAKDQLVDYLKKLESESAK